MADWNKVRFDDKAHRREPQHAFYMFTLNARALKALSGIQRRTRTTRKEVDLGIQRRHEEDRSREIGQFVQHGYPWSELSAAKRESGRFDDLKKPGWLPTALVVNILTGTDKRRGSSVSPDDLITIVDSDDERLATVGLPAALSATADWRPTATFPIEVIDGQHRLWAFEDEEIGSDFELPVVAFHGLDISWQAYLFWTINIKPKKINSSLAFDLYPLLRSEDWLDKFEGHSIYRETRAQELVERLWASPSSPWYQRINMLGETGVRMQSQASWVRSLMATYVRSFDGRRVQVGGLFGAQMGEDELVLPWSRAQQAAFLIFMWQKMEAAVRASTAEWARALREGSDFSVDDPTCIDPAFHGQFSLIEQDQGIRTILHVTNDICWANYDDLSLTEWETDIATRDDEAIIGDLLASLAGEPVANFIAAACEHLADYDWRSSGAPRLTDAQRQLKLIFRGSSGYSEFRRNMLRHLSTFEDNIGLAATDVLNRIGAL